MKNAVRGGRKRRRDLSRERRDPDSTSSDHLAFFLSIYGQHIRYVCDECVSVALKLRNLFMDQNLSPLVWNAWKSAAKMSRKQTKCVPFNTSEEIFHFGRTFLHFSTDSSSSHRVKNQLSWRPVALILSCNSFIQFSVCWLKSENLPPGSEISF